MAPQLPDGSQEGARVGLIDIKSDLAASVASGLRDDGYTAHSAYADVAQENEIKIAIDALIAELGPVDVLVNNAGIAVFDDPLSLSEADWHRCFAVDLDGVWYGTKAVLPGMVERRRGSIVNVVSVHSFQIAEPKNSPRLAGSGQPEDVAAAIAFFASGDAEFTGTSLMVDGGRSVLFHD